MNLKINIDCHGNFEVFSERTRNSPGLVHETILNNINNTLNISDNG